MKRALVVLLIAATGLALSAAVAAADGHEHNVMIPATDADPTECCNAPVTYEAAGIVKKVDPANGRVVLEHDPVATLGWRKMTMSFRVPDGSMLAALKPDARISFRFQKHGSDFVITSVR